MKSYASVDRIEENFAVCEVEEIEMENSRTADYFQKETTMMSVLLETVEKKLGDIQEGDIIIIEHDGKNITDVYHKDEAEKQRRISILKQILDK